MKTIALFFLSLFAVIFSISRIVSVIRSGTGGIMFYIEIIVYALVFLIAMLLLSFGVYASERKRGRLKKRVEFFEIMLGKENK